jgi:ubiquinone/menaquinone biosynthesis C-methylase UbiE
LVAGIDINEAELKQAGRVFGDKNLQFIYGGIGSVDLIEFDQIIFAASIQYFSSLKEIIGMAMQKLNPHGEIHILDTHFYKKGEIKEAQQRTIDHFTELGFPEMSAFYFHHSIDELNSFPNEILYQPSFFQKKLFNSKNPFPWICIRKT